MIRKLFVAAVAAQAVYCAVIEKRAALGQAKIIEELTNVDGREFCIAYINAQPLTLFKLQTQTDLQWATKTIKTKSQVTITEDAGTVTKKVETLALGGTVTYWPLYTVTHYSTVKKIFKTTVSSTVTTTVTGVPSVGPYLPLRRRQVAPEVPPVPEILADSDPALISIGCSKVLEKYPLPFTIQDDVKTLSVKTTITTTVVVLATKTVKTKETIVLSTKTIDGTLTVQELPTESTTVTSGVTTTVTQTLSAGCKLPPKHTLAADDPANCRVTVSVAACQPTSMPLSYIVEDVFPPSNRDFDQYEVLWVTDIDFQSLPTVEEKHAKCCEKCYELEHRGAGCYGFTYYTEHDKCQLQYRRSSDNNLCPYSYISILQRTPGVGDLLWRPGPCGRTVSSCELPTIEECKARTDATYQV